MRHEMCAEKGKKEDFWREPREEMEAVPQEEGVSIGGDLNGRVGWERMVLARIHGGWGTGEMNCRRNKHC